MKLNNKGMSLVEIIISVALISIVLIFIFSMLINVNDINKKSEVNSTYLVHKALFLKNIEEDLRDASKVELKQCDTSTSPGIGKFYEGYKNQTFANSKQKTSICIKLEVTKKVDSSDITTSGYLGVYYYESKPSFVITYVRDKVRVTKDFPNFENNNINSSNELLKAPSIIYPNGSDKEEKFLTPKQKSGFKEYTLDTTTITLNETNPPSYSVIKIPIIGDDGMDYSFLISYRPATT